MDQKLSDLIDEKDREVRQFPTFDEFQAAAENGKEAECDKPAENAGVSSSEKSPEKVAETDGSSNSSNADVVSEPTPSTEIQRKPKPEPRPTQAEMLAKFPGLKTDNGEQLSHPKAPNVTAEEPPANPVESAQYVKTEFKITQTDWEGGLTFLAEHTSKAEKPTWWAEAFEQGKAHMQALSLLEGEDWINAKLEHIEKQRICLLGGRAALEMKVANASETARKEYQAKIRARSTNKKAANVMKVQRAKTEKVEVSKGIQVAEAMAKNFKLTDGKRFYKVLAQSGLLSCPFMTRC